MARFQTVLKQLKAKVALEARGTGIGYRAPPALRRSEWPNSRQGGNLAPSLRSGRIVQG